MLNSADLVAILSLSSFIIFSSSSSACSDNVSGLDAACGPIRSLLIALAALRRIVRLVCACLHPIRFERNSPLPHRPRLATNGHTIYDSSTQVAPMPHIEIRNVSVVYDTPAGEVPGVAGVSFDIEASQFLCIVGPSGCGKSTLLNVIAGFLAPTAGEIRIGGKAVSGHGSDRGVVFQDFAQLFPWRTALGNVTFGLEMRGVGKVEREEIALAQLKLVKLEKFVKSYPHHLSGGMQQRVAIARALAYNPSVLLMDEPFAALDALTRDEMQRLLVDVWRETKKTIVYVTHNVAEAVYLADRIVVLTPHPGTVRAELPVHLPRPRDPLSVEFLDYQKSVLRHLGEDAAAASK